MACIVPCATLTLAWAFGMLSLWVLVLVLVFIPPIMSLTHMVIIKKGGSIAGSLYGGRKARWTAKERFAANIEKIRYSKREGRFNEALALTNDVLKQLPNDPDTLFLKAQILHEGFGFGESAKKCLEIIMKEVPASEILHRWASSLYEDITHEREMEKDRSLPGKD
jgi:hypothetical protein